MRVTVELFGFPRVLAGRRAVEVEAVGASLADVARGLAEACPELRGRVLDPQGWLLGGYIFAVGDRFSRDPGATVPPGTPVLLVASAAGG